MNFIDAPFCGARRRTAVVIAGLILGMLTNSAVATPPTVDPPTVNFWRDACESTSIMPDTPEIERVIDATAFIVDPSLVVYSPRRGTYAIQSSSFTSFDGHDFTEDSLFYNDQVIFFEDGHPGRSAFLVSPDSVVTAPHTADWDLTGYYVLFDYENVPDGLGGCTPPDLSRYPASKVRQITSYYNGFDTPAGDHLVAKLNAPMLDRSFLRARRDGHAEVGDQVTVVGHPARLAKKIDTNAYVTAMDGDAPLVKPVHLLRFSSGSPLYNLTRQTVEMAVAFAGGCAVYVCSEPLVGGTCPSGLWSLESSCPASPAYVNSSIKPLAPHIESIALEVTPLSLENVGTAPDGFESPLTTYTLKAPGHGEHVATSIDYEIEPPEATTGPTLSIVSPIPLTGSLSAGASLSFDVAASMPAGQPCGVFPREFLVQDLTHGFTDRVRQTLEVGQTAFAVDTDLAHGNLIALQGIQQPYADTSALTIRNLRPTSASIRIRSNQPWLNINGDSGSSYNLPQSVITVPGHQAVSIVVGLSPASVGLALHEVHNAQVIVESANGVCNLTAPITRRVAFTPGVLTLRQAIGSAVPDASLGGDAGTLTSTMTVDEAFCVDEVKASYVIDDPSGTYPLANWLTESRWRVSRPNSLSGLAAWDHNILPVCDRRDPDNPAAPCYSATAGKSECEFAETEHSQCEVLSVGDLPRPSLAYCEPGESNCEPFTAAIGQRGHGAWTMKLEDRVHGGSATQPQINGWMLAFRGSPGCESVK